MVRPQGEYAGKVRRLGIAAAALVALAGCGGGGSSNADRFSGPKQDVARVVDRLQAAARAGDTTRICTQLFTPRFARELDRGGATCAQRVRGTLAQKDETIKVRTIDVRGDTAVAAVKEQNGNSTRLAFQKAGGGWRIDAITSA
jgi:hypothetical protein